MSKFLVSACLAGFPCRYDGKAKTDPEVVKLVKQGLAIPICPEQIGGLPTPRPAAELVGQRILSATGEDFTENFVRGAQETLRLAQEFGCTKAILKSGSPSCGFGQIYDGTFSGKMTAGMGITARLLWENGFEVESR
ncbi:DUF523 domain-containing protein [Lactococcus allomyrinae]|uniref:DUF523 domain-containing protein n=1 Tax=Lactococcus allomyrinae TaxID=2419773 RepID=A0A387BNE4_9LACT|nr:DUF523 domain-containing protein [Lactococcus allomyrinae]AYG00041.1 DUF523 domain-containing protein [Lactococcus allomyrinae]